MSAALQPALTAAILGLLPDLCRASFAVRPFSHYETSEPAPGSEAGIRRFHHREQHVLEDGSGVELRWQVDTDPSTIMPMDLHHTGGARVLECTPTALVLQLPEHHAVNAHQWKHVTASPHVHGCGHLTERDLYHAVVKVEEVQPIADHPDRHHTVKLTTKELKAANEVFPNCQVFFDFNPAGRGAQRPHEPSSERRLEGLASIQYNKPKITGVSSFEPEENHVDGVLNLQVPKQFSRLAWNWDYNMNTTKNPQFRYIFPGGVGLMRLYSPYLIADVGFRMNFTSTMSDIRRPPHVTVQTEINGTANLNADIAASANFTREKSAGVLNNVVRKFVDEFLPNSSFTSPTQDVFITPLKLDLGGTPLTIRPTFDCKLKAYHMGLLDGALRLGLSTELEIEGLMTFDTDLGMRTNFSAKAVNVTFTPPNWMIFTEAFEMGMMLEPKLCMRGGFANMEDMAMCLSLRPYFNVSLHQEGSDPAALAGLGLSEGSASPGYARLAVYPFRAVGLPAGKDYSIRVVANGRNVTTSPQMSTGVAEYFDDVDRFDFGSLGESELVGMPIQVQVLEDGRGAPKAEGTAHCSSIVNGRCMPNPLVAKMRVEGQDVQVELAGVFSSAPTNFLKSQTRSISLRFPTVTASGAVAKQFEEPGALDKATLRLTRNGRSYNIPLGSKMQSTMLLQGETIYELGPSFLGSWKLPSTPSASGDGSSITPKLELVADGKVVGSGNVPPIAWDTLVPSSANLDAVSQEAMQSLKAIPVMVPLTDSSGQIVGTSQIEIDVLPPSKSAFWVQPGVASYFTVGNEETFSWAVHGGQENMEYDFSLEALEVSQTGGLTETGWKVNITAQCTIDKELAKELVLRFTGGATPCLFMYKVEIPVNLEGHHVVMVAGWRDAGERYHEMLSAPIEFLGATKRARRLEEDSGEWGYQHVGHGSGPGEGYGEKYNEQLKELRRKACSSKPLEYEVGAGMTFVEMMENVVMPMSMPSLGESPQSDWTSDPIPVWTLGHSHANSTDHGKKLQELLPKSVCAGGVCNGMMPGCHKTQVNPMKITQIVFKLSREFKWSGVPSKGRGAQAMGPTMRHALAYALALLPSAVQVAEKQNWTGTMVSSAGASRTDGTSSTGNSILRDTMDSASHLWHKGLDSRRLSEDLTQVEGGQFEVEAPEEEEDSEPFNAFKLNILRPLHYELTPEYMRTLIHRGTLRMQDGREATHGPIHISSFELVQADEEGDEEFPQLLKVARSSATPGRAEQRANGTSMHFRGSRDNMSVIVGTTAGFAVVLAVMGALLSIGCHGGCRVRYMAVSSPVGEDLPDFA